MIIKNDKWVYAKINITSKWDKLLSYNLGVKNNSWYNNNYKKINIKGMFKIKIIDHRLKNLLIEDSLIAYRDKYYYYFNNENDHTLWRIKYSL